MTGDQLTLFAIRCNPLPFHNPLPSTPLGRTRLMPLAPARLPRRLPHTLPILTLMHMAERAPVPKQPIPLKPTIRPHTLMIRTIPPRLVRKPGITPWHVTGMILTELAPVPLPAARPAGVVAPVLAAVQRHGPVVAHVAAARAVRPRARLVLDAEAPVVVVAGGGDEKNNVACHPNPLPLPLVVGGGGDGVAALGVLARVPRAVLAAA